MLALCVVVANVAACSSDSQPSPGDAAGDAGSDATGGAEAMGGKGSASDAGEGGSQGADLPPGSWNEATWDQAVWQ